MQQTGRCSEGARARRDSNIPPAANSVDSKILELPQPKSALTLHDRGSTMYHAYGKHEGKRPVWQTRSRPLWRRKGTRSSLLVLFAVLIGITIFLASVEGGHDHRRSDGYKASLQSRGNARHQPKQPENQQLIQDSTASRTSKQPPELPGEPLLQSKIHSDSIVPFNHETKAPSAAEKDHIKEHKPSEPIKEVESARDLKEQDLELEPLENTLAIDEPPKPKSGTKPIGSEEEPSTSASDSGKEPLVEDESNESKQHLSLEQRAESLPEYVWVPFEEAVKNEVIHGWEDEWVSTGTYDHEQWGKLEEPKVDFVYLCKILLTSEALKVILTSLPGVNGSEEDFQSTIRPWEERSILNDPEGKWISSHGVNRYRDWDELRYSFRSIEKNAGQFMNTIKVLVNSIYENDAPSRKQTPTWLAVDDPEVSKFVQVVSQEEMFESDKKVCLPAFNSLTIENQMFNTKSDVDQVGAPETVGH
jgi:hypothetical protein